MNIGNILRRFTGRTEAPAPAARGAQASSPAIVDSMKTGVRVDGATYTRLMADLQKAGATAPVSSTRPPLDIENHRFGCEIEVAAPKGVDDPTTPPTADTVDRLIGKGYKFTIDGQVLHTDKGKVIEGGKLETSGQNILDIAKKEPGRVIATDPNTGEHHAFNDTDDPKVNTQYFHQYCKFKTFMEETIRPKMDAMGWIAEDTVDCQAHAGVAEAVRYIEVKNNPSTIAGGGKADVREVLGFLKDIGCSTHDACALQYHIDMTQFSPEEAKRIMQNLMRLQLENENILYRVAQMGDEQHRGVQNNFLFCQPLSGQPISPFLHAESAPALKNFWYNDLFPGGEFKDDKKERPDGPYHHSRYYGMNMHSYWFRGTVEMRYAKTTLDPDLADAHLDMALGMLKTAHDTEKYEWTGVNPLGFKAGESNPKTFQVGNDTPVPAAQMTRFLDNVIGDKPSRKAFLDAFFTSGGRIDESAKRDVAKEKATSLLSQGYSFINHVPDLDIRHPASDAVEVVDGVRKLHCEVEVKAPNATEGVRLQNAEQLEAYLISH